MLHPFTLFIQAVENCVILAHINYIVYAIERRQLFLLPVPFSCQASDEIVNLLLDYKLDVHAKNRYEETPLHLASRKGREGEVNLLVINLLNNWLFICKGI